MAEVAAPETERERPIGFLGLMRNRSYALLWWGQLVSEMGNRFHWVAISLWVYAATHSASAVSIAVASMFVGGLLISLWAGVLVDWLNRKKILIISDLVRAALVALIPGLMGVNIWLVYADLALISVATGFFRPAMFAIMPAVVNRRDLLSANSFFTAMDTGTEILGPAAAGLIAFKYGYAPLLYFDAATYGISALCMFWLATASSTWPQGAHPLRQSVSEGIMEGLRYVRRDRLQWQLFVLIFPAYLVGSGLNALQTPLAKGAVGITDAEFGTFQSIWGVGFLVASLLLGWFGARVRKSSLIIGGFFLGFAAVAAMSRSTSFELLLVTAFAVGFAFTLNYVGLTTVLMEYSPKEVIGRVISTRQVALGSVRILAPLAFGGLADLVGVRESVVIMTAMGAVGTAAVVLSSSALREFDVASARPGPPNGWFWHLSIGSVDREFDETQQSRLNFITLLVALMGLAGLAYSSLYSGVAFLIAVSVTTSFGLLLGSRSWQLAWGRFSERMFAYRRTRARRRELIPSSKGNRLNG